MFKIDYDYNRLCIIFYILFLLKLLFFNGINITITFSTPSRAWHGFVPSL